MPQVVLLCNACLDSNLLNCLMQNSVTKNTVSKDVTINNCFLKERFGGQFESQLDLLGGAFIVLRLSVCLNDFALNEVIKKCEKKYTEVVSWYILGHLEKRVSNQEKKYMKKVYQEKEEDSENCGGWN